MFENRLTPEVHSCRPPQVTADILGVNPDVISTTTPFDSDVAPWGVAAANSGNNFHLYDIGSIIGAATQLREKIIKYAAHILKAEPDELTIADSVVSAPGSSFRKLTFDELGKVAYNNQALHPAGIDGGLQTTFYYNVIL